MVGEGVMSRDYNDEAVAAHDSCGETAELSSQVILRLLATRLEELCTLLQLPIHMLKP